MRQLNIIIIMLITFTSALSAQIGINNESPDASAVLDIRALAGEKGLLVPRMTNVEKLAITNPASSLIVYDTDLKCISQYNDSQSNPGVFAWTCLTLYNRHFFYMPSINVRTSDGTGNILAGTQTENLYNIYRDSFTSPKIKSTSAPVSIPIFGVTELNYYVTYSDPCITITEISNTGVLRYTVNNLPDYDAYINIVFTVK